ncbi:MAG: 2-amino-4-hydroxy-6-hydroxymethyldihydropteridine diphosphokinase [Gammaproteobacteria bacterium]|jgi:2-amino-4-hydroxy-6-hydroxymethyldihydropteridine diphosphokinase|nr:2-amino-4-hydroxy-6-hydroxymethyldihydropteridine diphosphokinase [Gammaproteobacteria bacterium]
MIDVYLGLGSNQQARFNLRSCLRQLESKFGQIEWSPLYVSAAVGFDGDDFLNMVVKVRSNLTVDSLHHWLHELEDRHQRDRQQPRFSDRTLDVDILLYGELVQAGDVILPRPEITKYAHVLKPLADLAPQLLHPTELKTMWSLWEAFAASQAVQLQPTTL